MAHLPFMQALDYGLTAEQYLWTWLNTQGFTVIPAYAVAQNAGKGPRCFAPNGVELITPDILALHPGKGTRWIDAKAKASATWHRNSATWQTGFDTHSLLAYHDVQTLTAIPVYIFFLHSETGIAKDTPEGMVGPAGLYCQTLHWLLANADHSFPTSKSSGGMHYWRVNKLIKLADYTDIIPTDARIWDGEPPVDSR